MKKLPVLLVTAIMLASCAGKKKDAEKKDNRIYLQKDIVNVVKLSDTLVITESTCRGCAYESSTAFAIKDSLQIVKLDGVETHDNNPESMSGGNISKLLVLVLIKTGTTNIKMYKFWKGIPSEMNDSVPFTTYKIEVQN
jgi:hypothetical protein